MDSGDGIVEGQGNVWWFARDPFANKTALKSSLNEQALDKIKASALKLVLAESFHSIAPKLKVVDNNYEIWTLRQAHAKASSSEAVAASSSASGVGQALGVPLPAKK